MNEQALYMHTMTGTVATLEEWKLDTAAMATAQGSDFNESWESALVYLVEVRRVDGEWLEVE